MTNPTVFIPAKARGAVYTGFAVLATIVGAVQIGYGAIEAPNPDWLIVALAVVPYLGAVIGYTAATHTPTEEPEASIADHHAALGGTETTYHADGTVTGRHRDDDGDGYADRTSP